MRLLWQLHFKRCLATVCSELAKSAHAAYLPCQRQSQLANGILEIESIFVKT